MFSPEIPTIAAITAAVHGIACFPKPRPQLMRQFGFVLNDQQSHPSGLE
jgi:hypothetical protein